MKLVLLLPALFAVLATACYAPPDPTERHKQLVRTYLEQVVNQDDWSVWDEIFPDTVHFNGRPMSRSDMQTMAQTFRSILSDFRMEIELQIAADDVVATRVTVYGKHTGDYMGLKASGKEVSFNGLAFDRFEDGKIVEMWHEMNIWGTLLMASDD